MAICHISATIGSKSNGTSAAARFAYICREGKWGKPAMLKELLTVPASGNMPAWATENPARYWQAADAGERQNGRLFQQVIIALPRELPAPAQIALAESFARELAQTPQGSLPYTVATHRGGAKDENPHAHIIVSERLVDGIDRTPDTWFKRAATSPQKKEKGGKAAAKRKTPAPENGGAKKSIAYQQPTWPEQLRSAWAERVNESLEVNNREERITPFSHAARGLDIAPTMKEGPPLRALQKQNKLSLRQAKNVAIREINERIVAIRGEIKKLTETISDFLKSAELEIAERKKQAALKRAAKEKEAAAAAREEADQAKLRAERHAVLPKPGVNLSPEAKPNLAEKRQDPVKTKRSKGAETTQQQQPEVPKAQEKVVTQPVAAQPSVNPYKEWILEHYPGVLKMPVSQAEQWFANQIVLAGGREAERKKPTAKELFMADDQNEKSVQFRADIATVQSLNREIAARETALAERPRGLLRFKTAEEKTYESELKTKIPDRKAAQARIDSTAKWWDEQGLQIYLEKAKDRSRQVDRRVAELEEKVKQWTLLQESILPLIRTEREKERALKPKQKVRERDWDLGR